MAFVAVEVVFGLRANSVALLADAGHNLSDVLGLLLAWSAASLSSRERTENFSYGLRRSSILAALFNALLLLVALGAVAYEAVERLFSPQAVVGSVVVAVAGAGILVNGFTALLFASGRKADLNVRAAFSHMAADALVSTGVVIAGLVVMRTGWLWLDPAASLIVVLVILAGTWGLLRSSLGMALDRVPEGIAPAEVDAALTALDGVTRVHDLHVWSLSTTDIALTCHLVMPAGCPGDAFLHDATAMLNHRFRIRHATIQVERNEDEVCPASCR